jgi:hypothetical protein
MAATAVVGGVGSAAVHAVAGNGHGAAQAASHVGVPGVVEPALPVGNVPVTGAAPVAAAPATAVPTPSIPDNVVLGDN